jgi:GNAT superfamily N-acetyltransferase
LELKRLEPDDTRPQFSCGDDDLNEFFHLDSVQGGKELLSVTYSLIDNTENTVAYFSLSNDSIKKEDCPKSAFRRLVDALPHTKRYKSMPAVKIGRLGIAENLQGSGYGTKVLDFLKVWFTQGNKTGCRFLVVDAYNKAEVKAFYAKNGFRYLTSLDENEEARIMYYDLIKFRE